MPRRRRRSLPGSSITSSATASRARARASRGFRSSIRSDSLTTDVKRPRRLCVPVDKNGETPGADQHQTALTCYDIAHRERRRCRSIGAHDLFVTNQFGSVTLERLRSAEVCIPTVLP